MTALYSNYNVLTISIEADGKYQVGDIFYADRTDNWRTQKFHLLKIQSIDYCWGVRLHFNYNEWKHNANFPVTLHIKETSKKIFPILWCRL